MGVRSYREIIWYLSQFCLTRIHGDGTTHGSIHGFQTKPFGPSLAQVGDLVAVGSAPISEWSLSWVVEIEPHRHLLESCETNNLSWWSNVSLDFMERDVVASNPQWRWTDRQYAFNDRWRRVCFKDHDAYIKLPLRPVFGAGHEVTLGVRTRHAFDDELPTRTFPDWRKVTKKVMSETYLSLAEQPHTATAGDDE